MRRSDARMRERTSVARRLSGRQPVRRRIDARNDSSASWPASPSSSAACGGATTTLGARRPAPGGVRAASAAGESPRRARPTSPTDQILRSTSEPGSGRRSTRTWRRTRSRSPCSSRPQPRPDLLRQGPQDRPGARRGAADVSADGKTFTFNLTDAQVQQRRPDRRRRLRLQLEAPARPAHRGAVHLRHRARSTAPSDLLGIDRRGSRPDRRRHRRAARQARRRRPGRQDLRRQPGHPGDLLPERRWRCGSTVPIQEKWITSAERHRGRQLRQLRPVHPRELGPQQPDRPQAEPELVRRPKPTLTEIDMPMFAEPAQAQRAYEAGELDLVCPIPDEDIQRVKDDPALGRQYSEIPTARDHLLRLQQRHRSVRQGHARACADPKACPTINKDFRIALTAGDRQAGLHRRHVRGHRPGRQQLRHAGHPGLRRDDQPVSVRPRRRQGSTWTRPWPALGYASAADIPAAEVRLQHRRRPRAARRVPGRGLATRRSASRPSRSAATSASSSPQRTAGEYDIARDGWGADYPHANNQLVACSPAAAATTTASTATRPSTR